MLIRAAVLTLIALATTGCETFEFIPPVDQRPTTAVYPTAAVACDHAVASQAGAEILQQGGNAVDAAVAASFTLSVVRPYSCGIGGGGFMVIHRPATDDQPASSIALNYRETTPAAVGPAYYVELGQEEASTYGVHAVGIPGTVAGLLHALEHHGTLDRAAVLAPAIRAAEEGFTADAHFVEQVDVVREKLFVRPEHATTAGFIWNELLDGGDLRVGDRVTNPAQGRALRLIAEQGADAFYRGPIADAIVRVMRDSGGPITRADLDAYTIETTTPLRGSFGGYEVLAFPPPSSGGVAMLQILGILERRGVDPTAGRTAEFEHILVEAMKHAFADRAGVARGSRLRLGARGRPPGMRLPRSTRPSYRSRANRDDILVRLGGAAAG